ncbi:MAG: hypothetical protein ACTHK6_07415 [Solirubrobacterales bacterium]
MYGQIPAVCDDCGQVFRSGMALGPGAGATVIDSKAGPCPHCGGWGSIPNGAYRFVQEAERVIQPWTSSERESLADELRAAVRTKERRVVEQAVRNRPGLREVAERLLIPRDAAAFWGLVAVLIALVSAMSNQGGETDFNLTEQTTIDVSPLLAPTPHMPAVSVKPAVELKRPPLPPRKRREQAKKKRKKR